MRLFLILTLVLAACQPSPQLSTDPVMLASHRATGPRWLVTTDGHPALSWVDHPEGDTTLIRLARWEASGAWTYADIAASRGVTDASG